MKIGRSIKLNLYDCQIIYEISDMDLRNVNVNAVAILMIFGNFVKHCNTNNI